MKRTWTSFLSLALLWAAAPVALLTAPTATAVAAESKPVVVVSVASLDKLLANVDTLGEISQSKIFTDILKLQATAFLEGVDKKRPAGVIMTIGEGGGDPFDGFGFVPVTDFKALINKLGGDDAGGGVYEISAPRPVFVKEHKGFACFSVKQESLKSLPDDPVKLLKGQEKEYDLAIRGHAQNVPEFLRNLAIDNLKNGAEQSEQRPGESDDEYKLRQAAAKASVQQLVRQIEDADQITIGWNVDASKKKTNVELTLTALPNTDSAKMYAAMGKGNETRFAGFIPEGAAATLQSAYKFDAAAVEPAKETLKMLRKMGIKNIDDTGNLPEEAKGPLKSALNDAMDVVDGYIAKGTADGAASVQLSAESMTVLGAFHVVDGAKLEGALKKVIELASKAPDFPEVKMNAETHKGVRFHVVTIPVPEAPAAKLLGEKTDLVIGFSDADVYFALGREAISKLKGAIDASAGSPKAVELPMQMTIALGPILTAAAANDGNPILAGFVEEVGKYKGKDRIVISARPITNGVAYRFEVEEGLLALGGKAIALLGAGRGRGF